MTAPSRVRPAEVGHSAFTRRTLVKGAAWATPVAAFTLSAPAMALSQANCLPVGTAFDAQARGQLVSGSLLGQDLAALVEVVGVHAEAFAPTEQDQEANPLTADLLSSVSADLGLPAAVVSALLALLANQDLGVVNQYAFAHAQADNPDQAEVGASGAVSDGGVIDFDMGEDAPPALGTLNLHDVLTQATGLPGVTELLAQVADLELEVGAVGGSAVLDSLCEMPGDEGVTAGDVERQHLVSSLDLVASSPAVSTLFTDLGSVEINVSSIEQPILDLLRNALGTVGGVLGDVLGGLLGGLGLSDLEVAVNLHLNQLTSGPIPESEGSPITLQLDGGDGVARVDLAALLGGVGSGQSGEWLNGLFPNTRLFADVDLPTGAVVGFVDDLLADVIRRVKALLEVNITIRLTALRVTIQGTLAQVLDGSAVRIEVYRLLSGGWVPVTLANDVLSTLVGGVVGVVEGAVDLAFSRDGVLDTALDGVNQLLDVLFSAFGDNGVLALTVNAQNEAAEPSFAPPAEYTAIERGRFDVAALHVALLDGGSPSGLLNLSVARGSVGKNTPR
ncbi:choice-of-anchor G family protein [Brachybacterium conglomeratum]|uniref:choice-of-anchor G family protein n=1 Tax=Brachybacterium conglomeratum TaxID=47846 RepID=UPI003DA06EF0